MKLRELPAYLDEEFDYPIDREDVLAAIGGVAVEAPDRSESETISTILDGLGKDTYGSAEALFEAILGNVSDEYIGRKFYDDRGGDPVYGAPGPTDEADISF